MNTSQYCSFNSFTSTARTAALDEREGEGVSLQENSHHKYYKCGNCSPNWVFTVSLFSLSLSRVSQTRTQNLHLPQISHAAAFRFRQWQRQQRNDESLRWNILAAWPTKWMTDALQSAVPRRLFRACSVPAQTGTGLITAFKSHRSGAQRSLRSQSPVSGAYISIYTYVYSTYIVSVYVCVYMYLCIPDQLSILNNLLTQSSMANNNKRKWEKCWGNTK